MHARAVLTWRDYEQEWSGTVCVSARRRPAEGPGAQCVHLRRDVRSPETRRELRRWEKGAVWLTGFNSLVEFSFVNTDG